MNTKPLMQNSKIRFWASCLRAYLLNRQKLCRYCPVDRSATRALSESICYHSGYDLHCFGTISCRVCQGHCSCCIIQSDIITNTALTSMTINFTFDPYYMYDIEGGRLGNVGLMGDSCRWGFAQKNHELVVGVFEAREADPPTSWRSQAQQWTPTALQEQAHSKRWRHGSASGTYALGFLLVEGILRNHTLDPNPDQ